MFQPSVTAVPNVTVVAEAVKLLMTGAGPRGTLLEEISVGIFTAAAVMPESGCRSLCSNGCPGSL